MPSSPKPRCRVCHQLHCTNPEHKWQPSKRGERVTERPDYSTSHERKRRAATVAAFMAEHGFVLENGDVVAHCPECRRLRARFVADHIVPLIEGGSEDGELRVHCRSCSGKQGARIAARRRA
jgi:hypothetical protein